MGESVEGMWGTWGHRRNRFFGGTFVSLSVSFFFFLVLPDFFSLSLLLSFPTSLPPCLLIPVFFFSLFFLLFSFLFFSFFFLFFLLFLFSFFFVLFCTLLYFSSHSLSVCLFTSFLLGFFLEYFRMIKIIF